MKWNTKNSKTEEPEVVKDRIPKGNIVMTLLQGFAMKQTAAQVTVAKKRIAWITTLYMVLIVMAMVAVVALIGVALFTFLPEIIATILLTLIAIPVLGSFFFVYKALTVLHGKPFKR